MRVSLFVCTSSTAPPETQHFRSTQTVVSHHLTFSRGTKGLAGPDTKHLSTTRPGRTCKVGGSCISLLPGVGGL